MKYGVWNVSKPEPGAVNALVGAGYSPLTAMILAARGMNTPKEAKEYLGCDCRMPDPFLMTDMDLAAGRVGLTMARGERIAVFGDYDVDGITATCLLTDFLRSCGADVVSYIPGRMEEGYGLNPMALRQLCEDGVKLISVSAYRSYEKQQSLYKNKVNYYLKQGYSQKGAENKASTIVAIPGTSDHSLGLAVDFNYLEQRYENKPELVWLKEHAEEYGFVMRYAKDKEQYTGVIYEPWHYRYVGKDHARKMNQLNMCLEEYVEYLQKNS